MTNTKPRRLALAAAALALFAGVATTTAAAAAPTPDACSYKWCVQSGTTVLGGRPR